MVLDEDHFKVIEPDKNLPQNNSEEKKKKYEQKYRKAWENEPKFKGEL